MKCVGKTILFMGLIVSSFSHILPFCGFIENQLLSTYMPIYKFINIRGEFFFFHQIFLQIFMDL